MKQCKPIFNKLKTVAYEQSYWKSVYITTCNFKPKAGVAN